MTSARLALCIPLIALAAACDTETGGSGTEGGTESGTDTDSGGTDTTGPLPEPLPPLDSVPLTTDETILPSHAVADTEYLDPRIPEQLQQMLDEGYGAEMVGPGEPVQDVTPDMSPPPAAGANAALLSRFVHLADTQLADDESPARVVNVDNPELGGAFRPGETHMCHVLNAAVRTINAINDATPIDFVVLGGDNADSAQTNEVQWFIDVMDGAPVVHCDSGDDDDPVPGPDNDPKDPFAPVGLEAPWLWVSGNHDVLVQGNFTVESQASTALGDEAGVGTRDWSRPGGPVVTGTVPPDPMRALLDRAGLLELVAGTGDGHGIGAATVAFGKAYYTYDADDALRVIVVDSAAETGAELGVIRQGDVDTFLRPALDQAEADGVWVIVASHHASNRIDDGGGFGGTPQPDAITEADWIALLGEYPNVIMHLAGHSHVNRVGFIEPTGGNPYWEVLSASLVDWPHQMRLLEVRDEDNGFLSITGIAVDYSIEGDALAAEGRERGVTDYTTAWQGPGNGQIEDRNVRLWWAIP